MVEVAVWLIVGFFGSLAANFFLQDDDFKLTYGTLIGCLLASVLRYFLLPVVLIWGVCWCFSTKSAFLSKSVFGK